MLMCESINELTHLQINEFLYPYLAFRNANTIEVWHSVGTSMALLSQGEHFFQFSIFTL